LNCQMISRTSLIALAFAGSASAQDIEVRQLGALDPLEVQIADTPLESDLWRGSSAETARAAMSALPGANGNGYASPALTELAGRVLLSGGEPPAGARGDTALAALRADRALAAAGAPAAFALLERTPGLERRPGLAMLHAELAFALGRGNEACRTANGMVEGRDQPYWLRARAFCHALNGQDAAAELSVDLARAVEPDETFDTLLFALTLEQPIPSGLAIDSGLEWALVHVTADGAHPDVDVSGAPRWLRDVAELTAPPAELPDEWAAALSAANAFDGSERAAAFDELITQRQDRLIAGIALGRALNTAKANGRFLETAFRYGREINTLPVSEGTIEFGGHFVMAALLAGDVSTARRWRRALDDGPPSPYPPGLIRETKPDELTQPANASASLDRPEWSPPPARYLVALDTAIAVAEDRIRRDSMEALLGARLEAGPDALASVAALASLGASAPIEWRIALLEAESGEVDNFLAGMEAADFAGARAETLILAIAALSGETDTVSAQALMRVCAMLDRVGFRDMALKLVVERIILEIA
jgi:hypothetical protein